MITAVADANIYISALLFGGPCETILGMARAGLIDLSHSPAIERELRRILECALAARADYLITGDKRHLQPLKHFRGISILSPRTFLNLFS